MFKPTFFYLYLVQVEYMEIHEICANSQMLFIAVMQILHYLRASNKWSSAYVSFLLKKKV